MNNHTQDLISGEAVEITLNNGKTLREVIQSADLIGIMIETTVVDRSGGTMQMRVIPWAAIQDVVVLSEGAPDPEVVLRDHRISPVPLGGGEYGEHYHLWSGVSGNESEDGGRCYVCTRLSSV